jgi:conjugative relaxase-like TrwC/TraI family protein
VITIKAQSSPRNATRYFSEHLSHDDYYSEKEHTAGHWFGRTCDYFDIRPDSAVEKDQFTALCKGLRPDDQSKLTQRQKENRRCLYDLTASAPKSVSIMALVASDARLIAAHEKAVTAALSAAEELARVRVRKGAAAATNQRRATGNLIAARFQHKESRALDPQLHTHCIVFNVTHDPIEQKLKALDARTLYDQSSQLTQTYRDHLSKSLRDLGYEIYLDKEKCPQIRGVDKSLIALFSKRASQRDTLTALWEQQLGRKLTKNEVSGLVHRNRAKKQQHVDPAAVRQFQLEQVPRETQLELEKLKERALTPPRPPVTQMPPAPGVNWIGVVRFALRAARAVEINPYLFSPRLSFPERICTAARFLRHVQRTQAYMRHAQRTQAKGLSR